MHEIAHEKADREYCLPCSNTFKGVFIALMLSLGCMKSAAQKVKTDFDKAVDFSHFHTYSWRQHPALQKNPDFQEQFSVAIDLIRSAVNQNLRQRGFARVDQSPDFYITFFVTAKSMQDVRTISTGGWYGWGGWWYPGWTEVMVSPYAEGTLVLDIVDASTKQLAWRAYCKDEIRDMKTRHEKIERTAKKALQRFPPKVSPVAFENRHNSESPHQTVPYRSRSSSALTSFPG